MTRVVNSRIRLLLLVILLAFGVLLARATWFATVRAASLSKLAQAQTKSKVVLAAGRGTIFDAMGTPLALDEQATTVFADPRQIAKPKADARIAAAILGLKASQLYPILADRSHGFVYVDRKAPPDKATLLSKRSLTGFYFTPEEKRVYPQGPVAAPVLGYAGVDNSGLAGLELELNSPLTGTSGEETVIRDPLGHVIDVQSEKPVHDGHNVFLTLDHTIQANAEQVLQTTVAKWGAKDATAIVLDPKTGAVLAMAMEPGYNANAFPQAAAKGLQANHAVADVYEPGSVFKVVTIAETKLGQTGLIKWMHQFGFGQPTGIDFPGESAGLLPTYWSGSTIGNVPIGQGVSVTAIQLASVYAAIANGGLWVQPHLVDHVQGERSPSHRTRRIVSHGVDHELLTMLKGVVSDVGTAAAAEIPGYSVAGKTGTAQKPGPHGYIPGKYVATFVGMVPASNPRLVVLVTVDEPKLAIFGGVVAAPAFAQIAAFDLQYLEVSPDQPLH